MGDLSDILQFDVPWLLAIPPLWYLVALAVVAGFFLLCLASQLFFMLRWYLPVVQHAPGSTARGMSQPPVSVIICVHYNFDKAEKLIRALQQQDYPQFELVVVDDRNDDEAFLQLLALSQEHERMRLTRISYTPDYLNPKKYALTLGIKAARYDHLLLTDADCMPNSDQWIAQMMARFQPGTDLVLGFSPYDEAPGLLNSLIRFETLRTGLQYLGGALAGQPYMGVGRNLGYTRQLFFAYKGFYKHVGVSGGDDDLFVNRTARQHNTTVCIAPEALVYSEPKTTWTDWHDQKLRHYHVSKYYQSEDKARLGLLSLGYVGFYVALLGLLCFPWLGWAIAGGGWLIRTAVHAPLYWQAGRKLQQRFSLAAIPFIDMVYVGCFAWFSLRALGKKNYRGW